MIFAREGKSYHAIKSIFHVSNIHINLVMPGMCRCRRINNFLPIQWLYVFSILCFSKTIFRLILFIRERYLLFFAFLHASCFEACRQTVWNIFLQKSNRFFSDLGRIPLQALDTSFPTFRLSPSESGDCGSLDCYLQTK